MARITDVWAVIPKGTDEPQDWRTAMAQILVVVECDDGRRGFGVTFDERLLVRPERSTW